MFDGCLAGVMPEPSGTLLRDTREALRSSVHAHVAAIESGTPEQEVLAEAGVARVIQAIADMPEGETALRESAEGEDLAVRYVVAGLWRGLDRSAALRILRDMDLDYSRPLLSYSAQMAAALLLSEGA
ncbi:hypothetical protein [Embleya sp. NPDC005575]|uniref:hypothetical protein n=1 Tax=Embleya sp. NPDC005575 TaxID=3156892 RepID=UPI0033BA63C3